MNASRYASVFRARIIFQVPGEVEAVAVLLPQLLIPLARLDDRLDVHEELPVLVRQLDEVVQRVHDRVVEAGPIAELAAVSKRRFRPWRPLMGARDT